MGWAENSLLSYSCSNCWNFKRRDRGDLSCCHSSDVTPKFYYLQGLWDFVICKVFLISRSYRRRTLVAASNHSNQPIPLYPGQNGLLEDEGEWVKKWYRAKAESVMFIWYYLFSIDWMSWPIFIAEILFWNIIHLLMCKCADTCVCICMSYNL